MSAEGFVQRMLDIEAEYQRGEAADRAAEGVTVSTEWRVLHGGGADSYVRTCGTDEHNAREAARIWGGRVESRTVTRTEWAEVSGDTEAGGDRG